MALPTNDCDRDFQSFTLDKNNEVCRRVCDAETHDLLTDVITALGASAGTPVFDDNFNASSPGTGSSVNLITTSVGVGKTRTFVAMKCISRIGGRFELKLGGTIIGVAETGAGSFNTSFNFSAKRTGATGTAITVDFIQSQGPSGAPVSVSLMSTEA